MRGQPEQYASNSLWPIVSIFLAVTAVAILFYMLLEHQRNITNSWPQTTGALIETNLRVVGMRQTWTNGGGAVFQAYAHVQYNANGQHIDGWYPVMAPSRDREWLSFVLKTKNSALVRWNPKSVTSAIVTLQ
jgi:hypothetical protein